MELYLIALVFLVMLAISDLIVGVSNDAVNFLNSSFGSRVASRFTIMVIASLGIVAGVTFSRGMMEVARKGIFNPQYFTMPELMIVFLAVMLTDILLLDLYNTFGLPTSTTVSIVFELLGGAVALSMYKIVSSDGTLSSLGTYINTSKALAIISGILLSVILAFICGALVMFITRLIFTFEYRNRIKRFGALWGGAALAIITYFILIKGAKGASFMTEELVTYIKHNTLMILPVCFVVSALFLQALLMFTRINILKPIILIGTFALAMSFAANDLVNFIGVPLAGFNAYDVASASENPFTVAMDALQKPSRTSTGVLLVAGLIMVMTLWLSRKARTVTRTEINLGRQDEGIEQFGATSLSRVTVRMVSSGFSIIRSLLPEKIREKVAQRLDAKRFMPVDYDSTDGEQPSFDLLRASVNLMVASVLVSFATSLKLPLSTTYVTFMVAMGTSLSDQAWGRDTAVYRVTGVLTVIGGWFFTAFMAFTVSLLFALGLCYSGGYAVLVIIPLVFFIIWRNHHVHQSREKEKQELEIFDLKRVKDPELSIHTTFHQTGFFLKEINNHLSFCFDGLFREDRIDLKAESREMKKIQSWANVIIANIFKTLRLLRKADNKTKQDYALTIGSLQEITESLRDISMRSYLHVNNHHKGLLDIQVQELSRVRQSINGILSEVADALINEKIQDFNMALIKKKNNRLQVLIRKCNKNQIVRIQNDISKTRLSILFYALIGNIDKISNHTLNLFKVFSDSFIRPEKRR